MDARETSDPRIGQVLGSRYRVLSSLDGDDVSDRYLAENVRIGKRVTLRFIKRGLEGDAELVRRFENEARIAGAAVSAHAIEMIDVGRTPEGALFLVTECLDGVSVAALGDEPLPRALSIAIDITIAVESLHRTHGPHLALGPASFFVAKHLGGESTKLVDFGLASVASAAYAAPELARGEGDARSDVYSVGVILGRLLSGQAPAHALAVIERCTMARPEDRFPSMRAVENALRMALEQTTPRSRPPADWVPPARVDRAQHDAGLVAPTPARRPEAPAAPSPVAPGPRDGAFALGEDFRRPRDEYRFELEEALATVSPEATVKGLFLQSVIDRVPDRAALFRRAGLPDRRIVPFLDFPYHHYIQVLVAAAETLHPGVPRTVALRRFHLNYYETFAETLPGRVMFGVLGRDAERVMPIGPRGWQVNLKNAGDVRGTSLGPRHVRYVFAHYPALICECCDIGVVEGALRFFGESEREVRIRTPRIDHTEIDIRW